METDKSGLSSNITGKSQMPLGDIHVLNTKKIWHNQWPITSSAPLIWKAPVRLALQIATSHQKHLDKMIYPKHS